MGKRYYCDYCDKTFPDNPTNRRNHLNGVQHRTMRKLYYDTFQDPEIILAEDARKNPCRQFLQHGECKFGAACKFSHLTPADKEHLVAAIAAQQAAKRKRLEAENAKVTDRNPKNLSSDGTEDEGGASASVTADAKPDFAYKIPLCLEGFSNLPPSLLPPPPEAFLGELPDWG